MEGAQSNLERSVRAALEDILSAEKSWRGWNADGFMIANDIANTCLTYSLANDSIPSWHPSLLTLFPDIRTMTSRTLDRQLEQKLEKLNARIEKMTRQYDKLCDSAKSLTELCKKAQGLNSRYTTDPFFLTIPLPRLADLTRQVVSRFRWCLQNRTSTFDLLKKMENNDPKSKMLLLSSWLQSPELTSSSSIPPKHCYISSPDGEDIIDSNFITWPEYEELLKLELKHKPHNEILE